MGWSPRQGISAKQIFKGLMLLSVFCLFLPQRLTDSLDHALAWLLEPFTKSGRQLSLAVTDRLQPQETEEVSARQYEQLRRQYQQAVNKIVNLEQELHQQQELNVQLAGLRQQFGLARARLIAAQVVGSDSSSWSQRVILNQGSLQLIREGQLVLSRAGEAQEGMSTGKGADNFQMCVVGRIDEVGLRTSKLQLVTDAGFGLPVFIKSHWQRQESWRGEGVLTGGGMGQVKVTLVRADYPVRVGDAVLACSDPKTLPVELLVGQVSSCEPDKDNPVFWRIAVRPATEPHTLREVVVVDARGRENK